jgi:hypothetical protein
VDRPRAEVALGQEMVAPVPPIRQLVKHTVWSAEGWRLLSTVTNPTACAGAGRGAHAREGHPPQPQAGAQFPEDSVSPSSLRAAGFDLPP